MGADGGALVLGTLTSHTIWPRNPALRFNRPVLADTVSSAIFRRTQAQMAFGALVDFRGALARQRSLERSVVSIWILKLLSVS